MSDDRKGFLSRVWESFQPTKASANGHSSSPPSIAEQDAPGRLDTPLAPEAMAAPPADRKAVGSTSGVTLPNGVTFFSGDDLKTINYLGNLGTGETDRVGLATAYAAAAYAFAALHYRASKLSEPPLMVVKVDKKDGTEEWLPDHPMAPLLEEPSLDYDMADLMFRTSLYVDMTGQALWVKDANRIGSTGALTPFSANEFSIESNRKLMRALFRVGTVAGDKVLTPDEVILFQEINPNDWLRGQSRLEVFLSWLNLGQQARATVRDLLRNSVWPSLAVTVDKDWQPSNDEFEAYKATINQYGRTGQKGKAMAFLGGGEASVLTAKVKDLIPSEVFDRVESICSTVFGVPAIVLQFMVGMQNSPWSQMEEARKMCTQDVQVPRWRKFGKIMTKGLLRPEDDDPTHFIRFDLTEIAELQPDRTVQAAITVQLARIASVNERRQIVGLDPVDDPKADEIPELVAPTALELLEAGGVAPGQAKDDEEPPAGGKKRTPLTIEQKRDVFGALAAETARRAEFEFALKADEALASDRASILILARTYLDEEEKAAPDETRPESKRRRFFAALVAYLAGPSAERWKSLMRPLLVKHGAAAAQPIMADLGISFRLARPEVVAYAEREAAWLVTQVSDTTRSAVRAAVAQGVEEGLSAKGMAKLIEDLAEFTKSRALLIARTEATRVTQGAPTEALAARAKVTGKRYTKSWSGVLDERERDEHVAMEGETVDIDALFSNGLSFPSEPNCRCVVLYAEVTV